MRSWLGSREPFLDTVHVEMCDGIALGLCGGSSAAGARMNEDAAFLLSGEDPGTVFAAVFDAHGGSDSADLGVAALEEMRGEIERALHQAPAACFETLSRLGRRVFTSGTFAAGRKSLKGETSVLLAATRRDHLWWWNVGDVALFLLHPDYAALGQYGVNRRSFYEWVGRVHTFEETVPAYATGTKRLRDGPNLVLIATDGLFKKDGTAETVRGLVHGGLPTGSAHLAASLGDMMGALLAAGVGDSATIAAWTAVGAGAPLPSA